MEGEIRSRATLALVIAFLSSTDCGTTHSSEFNQRAAEATERQLAGHSVVRWHKPNNSGAAITFPSAIFQDGSARFWVGNGIGLHSYDEKQDTWTNIPREALGWRVTDIKQIAESNDGSLWIRSTPALFDNLRVYEKDRWHPIPRFSESRVTAMFRGQSGRLWLGAVNELFAFDGKGWSRRLKASELIKTPDEQYISINAGLEDREGFLWIAVSSCIVQFDQRENDVKTYFEPAGLVHVRCILKIE